MTLRAVNVTMYRLRAVLFGTLLVAAACGERADSNALEADAMTATSTQGSAAIETTVEVVEMYDSLEELGSERDIDIDGEYADIDPLEDDPVWRCGEASLGLDQLSDFESSAEPSAEVFAGAEQFSELGEAASWVQLSDRWIADRRLLDTSPPALMLGDVAHGGAQGCVPTRATWMRPVAWAQVGDVIDGSATVAIESCIDPLEVVSDVRSFGVDVLLGLFTSDATTGSTCLVDGTSTLEVPVDLGDDGSVLSSQTWPFAPGDPSTFLALDAHPATAPVTPTELDAIECVVSAGATDLYAEYFGIPRGLPATFFVDGTPWLDHDPNRDSVGGAIWRAADARLVEYGNESWGLSRFDGGYSFFGPTAGRVYSFELRVDLPDGEIWIESCGTAGIDSELPAGNCSVGEVGGVPFVRIDSTAFGPAEVIVVRDGEELDLGFQVAPLDVTAEPGVEYQYGAVISDPLGQREPVAVDCGTFTVQPAENDIDRLMNARGLFEFAAPGAHFYMTLVTPDGVRTDAAMSFGDRGFEFVDADQLPPEADPHTIHVRLIEAISVGDDVTFEIDPWAGVVTSWSINGSPGVETVCLTPDTAPPDLRDGPCDPARDLIGKRTL